MLCIHKSSKPYVCSFCRSFHQTKNDLDGHYSNCKDYASLDKKADLQTSSVEPPMSLEKMRFLLAVLLKKISSQQRLEELGFNKRLIDDILVDSIESSGREPCRDLGLSVAQKLKKNVEILLEWTVPKQYMEKFRNEQRSTEELLEELTS